MYSVEYFFSLLFSWNKTGEVILNWAWYVVNKVKQNIIVFVSHLLFNYVFFQFIISKYTNLPLAHWFSHCGSYFPPWWINNYLIQKCFCYTHYCFLSCSTRWLLLLRLWIKCWLLIRKLVHCLSFSEMQIITSRQPIYLKL